MNVQSAARQRKPFTAKKAAAWIVGMLIVPSAIALPPVLYGLNKELDRQRTIIDDRDGEISKLQMENKALWAAKHQADSIQPASGHEDAPGDSKDSQVADGAAQGGIEQSLDALHRRVVGTNDSGTNDSGPSAFSEQFLSRLELLHERVTR